MLAPCAILSIIALAIYVKILCLQTSLEKKENKQIKKALADSTRLALNYSALINNGIEKGGQDDIQPN